MMRPIIGVCASHDEDKKTFFVRMNYMESLLKAGGMPILLPMTRDPEVISEMSERIDGLFLAGGGDVDPVRYHAVKIEACGTPDPLRDDFELALTAAALRRHLPIFGVCRGIQVLNVTLGGTLIQDIPTEHPGTEIHLQQPPYDEPAHEIIVEPGSFLADILGAERFAVNSTHHQAVLEPGSNLLIDARSPEGIVEAIHMRDNPKVFGVQFHPEHFAYKCAGAQRLFDYFVGCINA